MSQQINTAVTIYFNTFKNFILQKINHITLLNIQIFEKEKEKWILKHVVCNLYKI